MAYRIAAAEEVTILYWGDRFARDIPTLISKEESLYEGGAAQLAGMVDIYRHANLEAYLLVAGGDLAGSIAALKTEGVSPAKILGRMKPDAYGPGVVDFTFGYEKLSKALKQGKIKAVLGNAYIEGKGQFLPPDLTLASGKVKIAVTALAPARLTEMVPRDGVKNLTVSDPFGTARQFARSRRDNADLLVVLSQLGRELDSLLAVSIPEIDLIIEGHSRLPFETPLKVGKTLIVATGSHGKFLGKARLDVSTEFRQISLIDNELLPVKSGVIRPHQSIKQSVNEIEKRYAGLTGNRVATLLTDWNTDSNAPANLPQWTSDAMRQMSGSSALAVVCNLDFEQGVSRGELYENRLFETIPFESPLVAFQIKGYEIRKVIENQAAGKTPFLTWSGLNVLVENGKVLDIQVKDAGRLSDDSEFAVVTNGLLWDRLKSQTGLIPEIRPIFTFPVTQRQLMLETAKKQAVISTPLDGRWTVRQR